MSKKAFNAKKIKQDIILWIKKYFEDNGSGCNAIIGISGGKDSSVVAALCVEALGKDRVIGVKLPCNRQADIDYANKLVDFLDISSFEINIGNIYETICKTIETSIGENISPAAGVSLKPRLRMCMLYAVAQTFNGRVANTGNKSENVVGYYTRFGDGAGDFAPIANLTVSQVVELGRECGLPSELIEKTPIDGLSDKTDEEVLGFLYSELDGFLMNGTSGKESVDAAISSKIEQNSWKQHGIFEYKM